MNETKRFDVHCLGVYCRAKYYCALHMTLDPAEAGDDVVDYSRKPQMVGHDLPKCGHFENLHDVD